MGRTPFPSKGFAVEHLNDDLNVGCVDPVVARAVGGRHAQLAAASARVNAAARGCGSAGGGAVRLCIFVTFCHCE